MNPVNETIAQAAKTLEEQIDGEIDRLNNLDIHDFAKLRMKRLRELREQQSLRNEQILLGHGKYEDLYDEKNFFETIKKSNQLVCNFYTNSSERCKIMDMHLKKLAPNHYETKFCNLNIEKCPFLADRLKIKVIPTVIIIKDQVMIDRLVGFAKLGNRDDFTTELLEWRLAQTEVIKYDGDLSVAPQKLTESSKKIIRDGEELGMDEFEYEPTNIPTPIMDPKESCSLVNNRNFFDSPEDLQELAELEEELAAD